MTGYGVHGVFRVFHKIQPKLGSVSILAPRVTHAARLRRVERRSRPSSRPCGHVHRRCLPVSWGSGWCLRGMLPGEVGGCWLPAVLRGLVGADRSRGGPAGPSRTLTWGDHVIVRCAVVYPLDLRAGFPDTFRSKLSDALAPDFLSWGCPKIAPPSTSPEESTPGRWMLPSPCLRARAASANRVPPSWFLTTSTVCSSPCVTRLRAPADPGVHHVSAGCKPASP